MLDDKDQLGSVLLDPNTLSHDGTVALTAVKVSSDGQWLAYATSTSGSDWRTWHVRNIASSQDIDDTISWSKFSEAAWLPNNEGFFMHGTLNQKKEQPMLVPTTIKRFFCIFWVQGNLRTAYATNDQITLSGDLILLSRMMDVISFCMYLKAQTVEIEFSIWKLKNKLLMSLSRISKPAMNSSITKVIPFIFSQIWKQNDTG